MMKKQNRKKGNQDNAGSLMYMNSHEHLLDELTRIDLLLHLQLLKFKSLQQQPGNGDTFPGLYISEQEITESISGESIQLGWFQKSDLDGSEYSPVIKLIHTLQKNISDRIKAAEENGVLLNIVHLAKLFGLSPPEIEILLICLAANLDLKYEKIFAYLQNDITRKHPGVDLILNMICSSFEEKLNARDYFSRQAPLFRFRLLEFIENGDSHLLSKQLKLNERIVDYLSGKRCIDTNLEPFVELYYSQYELSDLILEESLKDQFIKFLRLYHIKNHQNVIFSLFGPYGAGRHEAAGAFCREIDLPLLIIDLTAISLSDLPIKKALELLFRESLLLPAVLYFKNLDALFDGNEKSLCEKELFLKMLNENSWLTFISAGKSLEVQGRLSRQRFIEIEFPVPDYSLRQQLWQLHLNGKHSISGEIDLNALANKFNFTHGQIRDAIHAASTYSLWRSADHNGITAEDLYKSCREQSNRKLTTLAQKIKAKYTWQDIILPKDQMAQLREITNYVKYKHVVYGEWGFDRKFSLGKGLNVLFSGPSGTGKTMAAEIMANELNLDLYKIDLSTVVSKYIGETEKNLNRIFNEAERSNVILFFDEADALLGKRSEVKDAHDRYANIEIAYLLQKMEEYEGITVLATNLRQNIDDAFTRRIRFIIEFPFPDEDSRLRIWKGIFPAQMPLAPPIDLNFMARQFKISGGNIRNIALSAAFYAAGDETKSISMDHIILATKREYQKMGKICAQNEFGKYYEII